MAASPTPLGALQFLVREIREMIYAFVFAAGSTSLTWTSKGLYTDTKPALLRSAVYRVHIELGDIKHGESSLYAYRPWKHRLQSTLSAKPQNLDLHIMCPKGVRNS